MEITRVNFIEIFEKVEDHKLILECFEENTPLFETPSYVFIFCDGDVTILNKLILDQKPQYINWYKLYHIGRALHLEGFEYPYEINDFLLDVVDELKETYRKKGE